MFSSSYFHIFPPQMSSSLTDCSVLVTGASAGIGAATAVHFAKLGSYLHHWWSDFDNEDCGDFDLVKGFYISRRLWPLSGRKKWGRSGRSGDKVTHPPPLKQMSLYQINCGSSENRLFVIDISCWLGVERLAPLRWSHWPWILLQSRFVGFLQAFSILLISFKHFQSKTFKGEFALTTWQTNY